MITNTYHCFLSEYSDVARTYSMWTGGFEFEITGNGFVI
jgi:hypothetical protein